MLTNIKISNFKCFQKANLNFKSLTVLAGGNACGKSSIIQILRYIGNLHYYSSKWRISTKLDDIDFGTANDMFSDSATEEKIKFELNWENRNFQVILSSNSKNTYELLADGTDLRDLKKFTIYYLNAERRSPKTLHEISDNSTLYVGSHGEFTISLFNYLLLQSRDAKSDCYNLGNQDAFTLTLGVNFISDQNTYYGLKRHYLQKVPIEQLSSNLNECYPNLIFNSDIKGYNMNEYTQKDISEVINILSLLDEEGLITYKNYSRDAARALAYFKSKGFICSGESHPTNCNVVINNTNIQLACSPHFKIEKANSDKRLYFAWGAVNYNKIIICSIGKHLK